MMTSILSGGNSNHSVPENSSRTYRGVRQGRRDRYVAEIREPTQGLRLWLGVFNNCHEAAMAYESAARRLYGDTSKPSLPDDITTRIPLIHHQQQTEPVSDEPVAAGPRKRRLNKVYSTMVQEERVLNITQGQSAASPDIVSFAVKSTPTLQPRPSASGQKICSICSRPGHDAAGCFLVVPCQHCHCPGHDPKHRFKIIGYPEWWNPPSDAAPGVSGSGRGAGRGAGRGRGALGAAAGRGNGRGAAAGRGVGRAHAAFSSAASGSLSYGGVAVNSGDVAADLIKSAAIGLTEEQWDSVVNSVNSATQGPYFEDGDWLG
ncbi:OLC1v1013294C1 [Oldenlandia corymbosa var. corymbosa]|uniref:OLC1v1013294C1 n=1 Tax=Oldenlandia corymbosa var. corymbosa TaxID=529605 RepID=A0AAV1DZZ8_OLDCO|nr:OLC1v1013294C1 [Oldenlandia corymbosa var. corymbosa]